MRPLAVEPASSQDLRLPHAADHPKPKSGSAWAALAASFLGWTLDAFDFFLVPLCLTAIAKEFHQSDKAVLSSLAVTLAFRPVGAFLFGLMADRYGRRLPLMLDLVFYSVIEVATGFAPNFQVFLILRALFGIGMGGEWGVGASLAMEKVPAKWRGLLSGLLQEGYAFGYLLAAIAHPLVFPRFGWRPLFFLGGAPALLAIFVRLRVNESEAWKETKTNSWSQLGEVITANWKLFAYIVVLMTGMNLCSHGTQDMYPVFLERFHHLAPNLRSLITVISMIGAIAGGVTFGLLSDRFGRRRIIMLALGGGILVIPLWAYAPRLGWLTLGAFLIQFCTQGAWGVIPAHLSELSPNSIRGFLPGFAYQCGALLAGSVSTIEAILAEQFTYSTAMAATALLVFALTILVTRAGPENKGVHFGRSIPSPVTHGVT